MNLIISFKILTAAMPDIINDGIGTTANFPRKIIKGGTVMTEQEQVILIETEQRSKANTHRLNSIDNEIKEIKNDQKAIYKIATSVEVIAQRVSNIEDKVDDTNNKVNAQTKAWQETERRLTEVKNEPDKRIAQNVNSLRMAIVTSVCTFIATGIVGAIILLLK